MIPWMLYNLTPRDQGSPQIRPYNQLLASGAGAGTSTAQRQFTVPDDYCLLVTHINAYTSTPGTNVKRHWFELFRPGGIGNRLLSSDTTNDTLGTANFSSNWTGSPLFLANPGDLINVKTELVGVSAPAWTFWADVAGILIPRGTLSLT